jgi:basic membrane protein A and related proteins
MFTKLFSVLALWLLFFVLFFGPALAPASASADDTVRAAFLLLETGEDKGWSEAHAKGIDHARRVLGDKLVVSLTENVSAATAPAAIRKHVEQGADIVFGTSFDFMDAMVAAAQMYPKVKFEHCSGYKTNPRNLGTYFARMYQAEYLAGYMAGLMGFADVGTVGTEKLPETIRGINAFTVGLGKGLRESGTKHDPEQVNVLWLGSWRDAEGEKRLARTLTEAGHDLIRQMADTPDSAVAACRAGVPAIGYGSDARANGAECALVSTLFNWGPYYVRTLNAVMDGSWSPGAVWTGLDGQGGQGVALSEFHPSVPLSVRKKVLSEQARLEREGDDIFAGPLYSSNGTLLVKKGETASDAELLSMQLFVRGVAAGKK